MSWDIPLPYAVLLQDAVGHKEHKPIIFGYASSSTDKSVLRGELLARLTQEEVRELKHQNANAGPPLNFKYLKDSTVKLYCSAHIVHLLNYEQKELLMAISNTFDRHGAIGKVDWGHSLTKGSVVFVSVSGLPTAAKGVVRYIGKLPCEQGTQFGVELMV